jgi:hypothetical protein
VRSQLRSQLEGANVRVLDHRAFDDSDHRKKTSTNSIEFRILKSTKKAAGAAHLFFLPHAPIKR